MSEADRSSLTIQIPGTASSVMEFGRRAWQVPSAARAMEGQMEGRPTDAQRAKAIERARRERATWQPNAEAWQQLIQLHSFVAKRVRIRFFSPGTEMLSEDEWPHPVEGDCVGLVTLSEDGHLQPFLLLRGPVEIKTGGCSGLSHLRKRGAFSYSLAPVADFYEIERIGEIQ